jgi:hypothetical protein
VFNDLAFESCAHLGLSPGLAGPDGVVESA